MIIAEIGGNFTLPRDWVINAVVGLCLMFLGWVATELFVLRKRTWRKTKELIDLDRDAINSQHANYQAKLTKLAELIQVNGDQMTSQLANHLEKLNESSKCVTELENRITAIAETLSHIDEISSGSNLFGRARLLVLDGKLDDAISIFSELIAAEPTNIDALLYRGQCYFRKGRRFIHKAIQDFEIAINAKPSDAEAHLLLARAYNLAGLNEKAEKQAERAIELGTVNRLDAKTLIANSRKERRDFQGAIKAFESCPITHSPAVLGHAEILYDMIKSQTGEDRINTISQMIELLTNAINANAKVADYYTYRGIAYNYRDTAGDWEKALENWARASEVAYLDTKPWMYKGDAFFQRGLLVSDEAKEKLLQDSLICYHEALTRSAERYRPTLRNRRSRVYQLLGKYDLAVDEASAGVQENPDHVTNYQALATAAISAYKWKTVIKSASDGLNVATRMNSPFSPVWFHLFGIIGKSGDCQSYDKVIEEAKMLARTLEGLPDFKHQEWDWSCARERMNRAMGEWPERSRSLTLDSIGLVEGAISIAEYRKKYLTSAGCAGS